jgi:3-isopropylmalate/(R)-2-methylmalate dehydratase large subunit
VAPHTLAEKILLAHTDADGIAPGDIVMVRCDVVLTNDISGPMAFRAMERMGATKVFDPTKVVVVPDHFVPAKDEPSAELQRLLQQWAERQGVAFYGQGRGGIEHTVLIEEGWAEPGAVIAGGDSHTCTYGAVGAFGTGLGSTDIGSCLATGRFWQVVPGTIRIELSGERRRFVAGKDVILAVLAELGAGGGREQVLEFTGEGAESMTVDERMAVANMAVEAGSETGLFPADGVVTDYLAGRTDRPFTVERGDADAELVHRVTIDLDDLSPLVALPHAPDNISRLDDAQGLRVDQVYVGNCSNGTMTDLRQVAEVLRDRRVHPRCRMIVVPASQRVYAQALAEGLIDLFVAAGAMVSTPTCGACFGGGSGVLAAGERAVATTNRNFRGRMGSRESEVVLANAWVAAAAAVAGELVDPAEIVEGVPA